MNGFQNLMIVGAAAGAIAAPGLANASLAGHTLHAYYEFPTLGAIYTDHGTFSPPTSDNLFGLVQYTVSDDQITLSAITTFAWVPAAFNGLVFQDLSGHTGITGISLDPSSNANGATSSNASFTADSIMLNFGASPNWTIGQFATFDLSFGPGVPEPAVWLLMIAGFGAIGLTLRRRPAATTA